jgi:predicted phosphodiesterase
LSATDFALVHATRESAWRTLPEDASDPELESAYRDLGASVVVFGHTHRPSVRALNGQVRLLINTGSVGLPYDGDMRASYLLLDDNVPQIRKVEYDTAAEIDTLIRSGLPGAEWTIPMLRSGLPQLP